MNKMGKVLVYIGILFIILSLGFKIYDNYKDIKAGKESNALIEEINNITDTSRKVYKTKNGYNLIGTIYIDKISKNLPIIDSWDYDKLNVAPCVYSGSIENKDLVICAHSYKTHFSDLYKLNRNDYIVITEINGKEHLYKVCDTDVIDPYDVNPVIDNKYDLTLFSCHDGGTNRLAVYCIEENTKNI